MKKDVFRLISAHTIKSNSIRSLIPSSPSNASAVTAKFWNNNNNYNENVISILIGSNGTGKSRLLGSIAQTYYDTFRGILKHKNFTSYEYYKDGMHLNGHPRKEDLPSKVISVALTSFDKFPLEAPTDKNLDNSDYIIDENFYKYIGMRDRTNRASATALIYKAIEGIYFNMSNNKLHKIAKIFEIMGYEPRLRVNIFLKISNKTRFDISRNDNLLSSISSSYYRTKLENSVRSGRITLDDVQRAMDTIYRFYEFDKTISLSLDLKDSTNSTDIEIWSAISILRKAGFINLSGVTIYDINGNPVDLRNASSGQISIFISFLSIASYIENGSLILIDEPETGLHPEWQKTYVSLIREVFSKYHGCHFIISTHSPLIISDISTMDSYIYSLDERKSLSVESISGESSDYINAIAFKVADGNNRYVKELIRKAVTSISLGNDDDEKYFSLINDLSEIRKNADLEPGVIAIIDEILSADND